MIICPMCGAENDDIDDCCDQCGDPLKGRAPAADASEAPLYKEITCCPVCGSSVVKDIKEGEKACTQCGADLLEEKNALPADPKPAPSCPVCGTAIANEAAKACPKCGAGLPGAS
jgi:uncharacterized membrane protein YvbJ